MTARLLADNLLSRGTVTVTSTAQNANVRYLSDWRTYTHWEAATSAAQTITIDCGSDATADMLALHKHNLTNIPLVIETSTNGTTWTQHTTVTPGRATDMLPLPSATSRWWRITLPTMGINRARCACLALGKSLSFEKPLYGPYTPVEEDPNYEEAKSETGALLGLTRVHTTLTARYEFRNISDAWYRNTFYPLWESHLEPGIPFWWSPEFDMPGLNIDCLFMRIATGFKLTAQYQPGKRRRFPFELIGTK